MLHSLLTLLQVTAFYMLKIFFKHIRLSEACSHVGATLFAVETGVRRSRTTCTQEKNRWLMPFYVKEVSCFC